MPSKCSESLFKSWQKNGMFHCFSWTLYTHCYYKHTKVCHFQFLNVLYISKNICLCVNTKVVKLSQWCYQSNNSGYCEFAWHCSTKNPPALYHHAKTYSTQICSWIIVNEISSLILVNVSLRVQIFSKVNLKTNFDFYLWIVIIVIILTLVAHIWILWCCHAWGINVSIIYKPHQTIFKRQSWSCLIKRWLQMQDSLMTRFAVTAVLPCFTGFYGILPGRTR